MDEIARHKVSNEDKLQALRAVLRRRRDLGRALGDLENRIAELKTQRHDMDTRLLPGLFMDAGVDHLGIPAKGNEPAMDAVMSDFYRASIPMDWPADRKDAAFAKLSALGLDGVIKRVVETAFSPGDKKWKKLIALLEKAGFSFSVRDNVHWKTLTAAIQELCEEGKRPSAGDLDTLNAFVGKIVVIKPRSE
jgi:hypothetical protein